MVKAIRAHFDGKVIVPDEPLDLPVDATLHVQLYVHEPATVEASPEERHAAAEWFANNAIPGINLPDEALSREVIYGDD